MSQDGDVQAMLLALRQKELEKEMKRNKKKLEKARAKSLQDMDISSDDSDFVEAPKPVVKPKRARRKWKDEATKLEAELEAAQTAHKVQILALEAKLEDNVETLSYLSQRDDEFIAYKKKSAATRKELNEKLKALRAEKKKLKEEAAAAKKEMKNDKKITEIALKALT